MKSMKKLVLVGFVLLASVMVLVGCDTNAGDSSSGADAPTQQPTGDDSGKTETPKFTVKFETNHGTTPKELVVESGTKLTEGQLPSLADTDDYIFEGWQVKGTTTLVQAGFEVTKDVTLVAKWRDRGTTESVTFSSENGTKFYYGAKVTVSLSSTTEGATIKYKIDDGDWQDYSGPIEILSQNTITAYAIKEGLKDSEETSAKYLRELTSISITPPTRTVYSVGEKFDPTGMVVKAKYDDDEERTVEGTITSDTSTLTTTAGINKAVTVSYTEGEKSVTDTFAVDIVDPSVPTKLTNYISPNNTDDTWTYVAFGEWPQSEAKNVTPFLVTPQPEGLFKGNYYSDSNGKYVKQGDKYFKVEPIVWRVLTENYIVPDENGQKIESGNALLLAEKILIGGIPYYVDTSTRTITGAGTKEEEPNTVYPNNYKYSTIRAWLNGLDVVKSDSENDSTYKDKGFLQTAFTPDAQKDIIADTMVDNSAASTTDAGQNLTQATEYACDDTEDKIFLLSEQEATTKEYGFDKYNAYGQGNTRIRVTTAYAEATGVYQEETTGYGGWWWLRSPRSDAEGNALSIIDDGNAYNFEVNYLYAGVVPALSISMNGN